MFRDDYCKIMALEALYEEVAANQLKVGMMLTRRDFVMAGILCRITPMAIVELESMPKETVGHVILVQKQGPPQNGGIKIVGR